MTFYKTCCLALIGATALSAQPSEISTSLQQDTCDTPCHSATPEQMCSAPPIWQPLSNNVYLALSGDFLYWQTTQTGMAYGFINQAYGNISTKIESIENVQFRFKPGVRASLGIRPHYDGWVADFVWTHLFSKAEGASNLPDTFGALGITPLYQNVQQLNNNAGTNASATWRMSYNTLDFDLNRTIPFGNCFGLKAHMGLRSLWMNQKYTQWFLNLYDSSTAPSLVFNAAGFFKEKIWGLGPMLGIDSYWKLWRGFHLFGKASFAFMWSYVQTHALSVSFIPGIDPYTSYTNAPTINSPYNPWESSPSFHTNIPQVSLAVGGEYSRNFCKDRYRLGLRLAWELSTLFDANYLDTFYTYGNLYLSGLTTGLDLDF